MPDWRKRDDAPKKPQPAPPSNRPLPGQPPPATAPLSPPARARGGWRKKGAAAGPSGGSAQGPRSWQGTGRGDEPVSGGTLRRWLMLGLLSVATLVLTGYFVWWVFFSPNKLPLRIVSVGRMASAEIQENLFGNAERNAWRKINTDNIEASTAVDNENDNQLAKLVNEDWLVEKGSGGWRGGGPRRQVAAFYVNATAVSRPRANSSSGVPGVWLVPQAGQPWAGIDAPEKSLVELADVLRNVAGSVRSPAWVWLVLDLQAPAHAPDGGDFECRWASRLREALADMAKDPATARLHDRLIVTLACADGQRNWPAPEFGSTFFGHWFKLGLSGAISPDRPLFSAVSLGQFQREFDRLVKTSVASRRYAIQTPVWLPESNVAAQADRLQLVSVHGAQPFQAPAFARLKERFGRLDGLWKDLQNLRPDAWRWDPLGTALAEARLIGLEQLIPGASDATVTDAVTQARLAIEQIGMPPAPPPVSLIEQHAQRIYVAGQLGVDDPLAGPLASSDVDRWPDRSPGPPAGEEPAALPPPEIADAQRPEYVWRRLVQQAEAGQWEKFGRPTLARALDWAGPIASGWIEMELLRLLRDEVEWAGTLDRRSESVGRAIRVFDRLQTSGTASPAELATWIREEQRAAEAKFLLGVDQLFAGQFAASQMTLLEAEEAARQLEAKTGQLAKLLTARDEALYLVPQLVQWSLGQRQFAEQADELPAITSRLGRLAEAWELARNVGSTAGRATLWPDDPASLPSHFELVDKIRALREEFESEVRGLVGADAAAKSNPQTFRQIGLVLNTALVRADDRDELHDVIDQFLAAGTGAATEGSAVEDPPHRAWNQGLDEFVAALKEPDNQLFWRAAMDGSLRRTLAGPAAFPDEPQQSPPDGVAPAEQLFQASQFVRSRTAVFASLFTGQDERRTHWPWTAARQGSALDTAFQVQLQRERLAEAAWGAGPVTDPNPLCLQLAERYQLPPPDSVGTLGGEGLGQLANGWNVERKALLERLARLEASLGASQRRVVKSQSTITDQLTVPRGNDWGGGVAELALANPGTGFASLLPIRFAAAAVPGSPAQPADRLALSLGDPATAGPAPGEVSVEVDASAWNRPDPPQLRIAWRGNSRIGTVGWIAVDQKREPYVLDATRGPVKPATITVMPPDEPPVINVLLLIDCSNSTISEIQLGTEQDAGTKILFDVLRETAQAFIDRLAEEHKARNANVQLNVMPFGYRLPEEQPEDLLRALPRHDGNPNPQAQVFQTDFKPLEADWKDKVAACINGLEPAGQTPLYSAVIHAARELRDRPGAKLIFVLSDGVNDIDLRFKDDDRTINEVEDGIDSLENGQLKVFYFNNFASYLEKKTQEEEKKLNAEAEAASQSFTESVAQKLRRYREGFESVERKGLAELNGLAGRRPGRAIFRQQNSASFQNLSDEFLASVPRVDVQAIARINGTDTALSYVLNSAERRYEIRTDQLPCDVRVTVVSDFFGDIQPRELSLEGGESIQLKFDRTVQPPRLGFPDFAADNTSGLELAEGDFAASGMKLHFRKAGPEQDGSNLVYELGFERTDGAFTRRPAFMVLQLESSQPAGRVLLTPDASFMPERHYPVARFNAFSHLPVSNPQATIWWAPVVPDCVVRVPLPEDNWNTVNHDDVRGQLETGLQELGLTGVAVEVGRESGQVSCLVKYPEDHPDCQRLVVICPAGDRVVRKVEEESVAEAGGAARVRVRSEDHEIELLDGRKTLPVELWLATPAVLEDWVREHPDKLWRFVPPSAQ